MKIRITIERDKWTGWNGKVVPAGTTVHEFVDGDEAEDWFILDSDFSGPGVKSATWERVDE